MVKPFVEKIIKEPWVLMASLAIMLAIPRFLLMLQGKYNAIAVIFVLMTALPFLLLTTIGKQKIGMVKPKHLLRLISSFIVGILLSTFVFLIGYALYEKSSLNWYVAIMGTIKGIPMESIKSSPGLFAVIALPAVVFSPVGEELFFRGMVHEAFATRFGYFIALFVDATFFAVTHIAHYGLSTANNTLTILLPSALWWMMFMALASIVFTMAKTYSGTIWGATCCHAGFNLAMMWFICYRLA